MMMNRYSGMVDRQKAFSFFSQTRLEPEFRLCYMKLCSSDNHYTTKPQRDNARMKKGNYAVRGTQKEKCKLKKQSEIEKQKVFSTNHKDFMLILKTDSFSL